jgi:DNA repair protein RadA/Sms
MLLVTGSGFIHIFIIYAIHVEQVKLKMSKSKSTYSCNECGGQTLKWQGQCPHCQAWNTLVEVVSEKAISRFAPVPELGEVQNLGEVEAGDEQRYSTGMTEFDRVLGGGLVHGSVVLLGGDPGIGKSTLLLQALCHMSNKALSVLYVSGEESARQVALRAQRLALDAKTVHLLPEIRLERIQGVLLERKPSVVVVDSIQTVYSDVLQSAPGSVAQVRECAAQLTRLAKASGIAIVMVGHVTKEGALAGPRVLEHMVDTVLYFEGDTHSSFRLVRAVKNRFGAVNELGVFAMGEKGLREVSNPSALFLSHHGGQVPGSCIMVTQEGTRPLLVEIQALVDEAHAPNARRLSVGLEQNRLAMLLAVLHRHAGIACFDQDVFVNAVGGVKVTEPGADLAILLAIVSSLRNRPLPQKMVVFGEVGLAGEVRPVQRGQERLREAAKLGFVQAIVPKANKPRQPFPGLEIIPVERVEDAVAGIR